MLGAVGIVLALALTSIQGCATEMHETTPVPTLVPTPVPTPMPTAAPTGPFNINLVTSSFGTVNLVSTALNAFVNSPQFLAEINIAMHAQIPDNYTDESLMVEASEWTDVRQNGGYPAVYHPDGSSSRFPGEYVFSANLQECVGLKTIQLLRMTDLNGTNFVQGDSGENLAAVIGAELGADYVECGGLSNAESTMFSQQFGRNGPHVGGAKLGLRFKKINAQISARVVQGTGDNSHRLCLNITEVLGNMHREDIVWEPWFGAPIPHQPVPSKLLAKLRTDVKLRSDSVVNKVENVGIKTLQDVLKDMAPCF
jgi:hypothetical protein